MLPFKSRGEVNTGVEMLLKKVLGMLGIVLLES
jgi:hypothetical protein